MTKKANIVIKYLIFLFLFIVLQHANLYGSSIYPFGFALLYALVWCNQNIFAISILYILSIFTFSFPNDFLISSAWTVISFLIIYFIHYKRQKNLSVGLVLIYSLIGQFAYIYFNTYNTETLSNTINYLILGTIFLYACINFFQSIVLKKYSNNLNLEQIICGTIFLFVLSVGNCAFYIGNFKLIQVFACLNIFFACFILKGLKPLFFASIIGLGASFATSNFGFLTLFIAYALAGMIFCEKKQYYVLIAIILMDISISLYLNVLGIYHIESLIAILLAFLLFYIIPHSFGVIATNLLEKNKEKVMFRNIVNRNREIMYRKLLEMQKIFYTMEKTFKSLIKGSISKELENEMLVQEILQTVCDDCPNKNQCLRLNNKETNDIFSSLIECALEKKITLMNVPNALAVRCNKINVIINSINNMVKQYKTFEAVQANTDASKMLIAEQLGGISTVMQELANSLSSNLQFDCQKEKEIIDELNSIDIICSEAIIYCSSNEIINCTLLIKHDNVLENEINKIVSKICGVQMYIIAVEQSSVATMNAVILKTRPKYEMIVGFSQVAKNCGETSGDTYSFININDDKFLIAISDGMGSGESAKNASSLAISLIENFYKAGFNNDTILTSVNKLLNLANNDVYSALDICVVDLRQGLADLIKIGAPLGFIKTKTSLSVIEAGALPLGILEEMRPSITKKTINHGDNIILLSDGIVDSFDNSEVLYNYINNLESINPQNLADCILNQAIINDKSSPNDDMTVVVGRIISLQF